MKFITSKSALLSAATLIGKCIPASSTVLPIIEKFLFDLNDGTLTISGTDLQTSMITALSVESNDKGKIAIPAQILLDVLKSLVEQPLSFAFDTDSLAIEITAGDGVYKLIGLNGEDFPKIAVIQDGGSVELPSTILSEAINQTLYAVGNDELRPAMTGVYCKLSPDFLTFVSTDATRLVRYRRIDIKSETEASFIIPKKALSLLKQALPPDGTMVAIEHNKTSAIFKLGSYTLVCRLIDEKYPDYQAVLPNNNVNKLTVDRLAFLSSLQRVAIFANKTTHQVRFDIAGNELKVSSEDIDFSNEAHERMHCQYDGEDITIGFNAKLLIEVLKNIGTHEISISMSTANRATLVTPVQEVTEEDLLVMLMPMMLHN